jgi:hypothetical protein
VTATFRPFLRVMPRLTHFLIAFAITACGEQMAPKAVETPRGTVTYKERVRPESKFEASLRDPSPSEITLLRESAAQATAFVAKYVPSERMQQDLLENLDTAFAAWLNSSSPGKESAIDVEWIVGAALGQYCIERLPVRWAVATDQRGPEFMIVGDSPPVWSYPLASVRYRIEDRKTDFVGAVYEMLVHMRQKAS